MLKSLIHDDPLHLSMPRMRFQRAGRANGIQWINWFSFSWYLSLMTDKLEKT